MKKQRTSFFLSLLIACSLVIVCAFVSAAPSYAGEQVEATELTWAPGADVIRDPTSLSLFMDEAGLLSGAEATELRALLKELSDRHQADIVIVTVNSLGTSSPMAFADDYFDYNGYGRGAGKDGLLLLVSMAERDWYISTSGKAIYAFTDAGIKYIGKEITASGLSSGDYARAFTAFANWCDKFFVKAARGTPFDVGNLPKTASDLQIVLLVGLVFGLIVAGIVTGRMKRKLRSVRKKEQAADYILPGSLLLSISQDEFLGSSVASAPKVVVSSSSSFGGGGGGSSTHTSSSGRSHGGGGGKF